MLHNETQVAEPQRPWFIPVAAMASLTLMVGIAWSSPAVSAPSTTASNVAATGATVQMALPVYFVGDSNAENLFYGLYRELVRTSVPAGATPAQKARAALAEALNHRDLSYLHPFVEISVRDLTVTPRLIAITLSGPGARGLYTNEQTRLAVQALVWTAQAGIGQGPIPVEFAVADGSTSLFDTYPTAQTYNRPAENREFEDLAPIWITSPALGQVFPAGTPVVAKGEACVFENTTHWQLERGEGAAVVKAGFATTSAVSPSCRGTWQASLGVLAAGEYTLRVIEPNMNEGQEFAGETTKTFTVK
jgi:hypothetical protein